jgi:hypothetical protein
MVYGGRVTLCDLWVVGHCDEHTIAFVNRVDATSAVQRAGGNGGGGGSIGA